MVDRLRVGVISSVHGIRGEAKVYPTTDDKHRFSELHKVYAVKNNDEQELIIDSVKYFKNMVICKFRGLDSPEDISKYKNYDLFVDRKDGSPLAENENYIADLIGLKVISDEAVELGIVENVFPTGANHVMEVSCKNRKNILFPYIKDCILDVDLEEGVIKVHILEGLLDI